MQAVHQQMQMFQQTCENRLQELQAETRQIWADIQRDNPSIDLQSIVWEPDMSEPKIVPKQMVLK